MSKTQPDYLSIVRSGDPAGLRTLYQEFLPRIANHIMNKGGSLEDAKDVFQDAIIVLYEKARQPDFKLTSGFYTFLFGVCRNIWGNRLQKKSRTEVTIPEDAKYKSDTDTEAMIYQAEENRLFWDAFKKLGEDCQRLMRLFFEKTKMDEITSLMGYGSVNYTKKRKFVCKEQLVRFVKEDERFEELAHKTG
jgi:RNA polymerase sigma factor (sigma-70 family)